MFNKTRSYPLSKPVKFLVSASVFFVMLFMSGVAEGNTTPGLEVARTELVEQSRKKGQSNRSFSVFRPAANPSQELFKKSSFAHMLLLKDNLLSIESSRRKSLHLNFKSLIAYSLFSFHPYHKDPLHSID